VFTTEYTSTYCTFEKNIEDILANDKFEFRRGREIRDVIGMLRIISE
jgi:hypothetical protein